MAVPGQPFACRRYPGGARSHIRGTGLGLRAPHLAQILTERPVVPWFEVLADNFTAGGLLARQLAAVRADYPITLHCVGMSIGACDALDFAYLRRLKRLIRDYEPAWVSDHVCFSSLGGRHYHDLLPLPYTEEALRHLSERIERIQDYLGQRILVENVSSYLRYRHSTLEEPVFIAALAERADCELLLDLNNVYVNQVNHGLDAQLYLQHLPRARIREIHLAGYEDRGDYLIDAHNHQVSAPVWALYKQWIQALPGTPTLIEWDHDIPAFEVLLQQAACANALASAAAAIAAAG